MAKFKTCLCGCGQILPVGKKDVSAWPDESKFTSFYREIDSGSLSILSNSSKDDIKTYIRLAMEDGYRRGFHTGFAKHSD